MRNTKFSFNAFILILLIFTALWFVFAVFVVGVSERVASHDYYEIEGTDFAIRNSTFKPSGLCRGPENTAELVLPGKFGTDWGAVLKDGTLFLNEYSGTELGLISCRFVAIDLETLQKRVERENSVLRGTCASGELVCVENAFMPALMPASNSLCSLYAASSPALRSGGRVTFYGGDGTPLYSVRDPGGFAPAFEEKYLSVTLEEVQNEN